MFVAALAVFILGAIAGLSNFYVSFARYPLHRLRGGGRKTCGHVFGPLFVAGSLVVLLESPALLILGFLLIAGDTGGLQGFIGAQFWHRVRAPAKADDN